MPRSPLRSALHFRYSLRALLMLMLLAGVVFAWVHRAHEQRAAVRALRNSNPGVTVMYDTPCGAPAVVGPQRDGFFDRWARALFGIDYGASVVSIVLSYPTDADLDYVERFPLLQIVELNRAIDVTDTGLEVLTRLPRLRVLIISDAEKITDAGLIHLERLAGLEVLTLDLGRSRVSDQALEALRRALPNCRIDVRTSSDDEVHQLARN